MSAHICDSNDCTGNPCVVNPFDCSDCPICMGELEKPCSSCKTTENCYVIRADCKHEYHVHCLYEWFDKSGNKKCCLCQKSLS